MLVLSSVAWEMHAGKRRGKGRAGFSLGFGKDVGGPLAPGDGGCA